jgi:DNA-binding LacI/PurR family transcriptional regulator
MKVDLHTINREAREPLHQQLSTLLRQAIQAGVYKPGERMEPERTFMVEGEMSYPTVSRAFRDLAAEGLIHRRVGAGTFVADEPPAAHPAIRTLGVFYYHVHTPYFDAVYAGIEAECRLHRIDLITLPSGTDEQSEAQTVRELEERRVDGIIGIPMALPGLQRQLQLQIERGTPAVTLGVVLPQLGCDAITFNNEYGGSLATRHLLELGHERIGLVAPRARYPQTLYLEIQAGMRQARAEQNLSGDPPTALLPISFHEREDREVRNSILSLVHDQRVTALICASDPLARFAMQVLGEAGLRVPDDISIIGFGDLPLAAQLDPPLTTVVWPLHRFGREAVRRVLAQSLTSGRPPIHMVLDTSLVIRRSTGQARDARQRLARAEVGLMLGNKE